MVEACGRAGRHRREEVARMDAKRNRKTHEERIVARSDGKAAQEVVPVRRPVGAVSPVFVIGLTGTIASGKEEVASLLAAAGFESFSLSDRVREEAAQQGFQPPSRTDLQRIGNALR